MKIQKLLREFLSQRGLKVKNTLRCIGKSFTRSFSIDFLGFTFKYSNVDPAYFQRTRHSKFKLNLVSVASRALFIGTGGKVYLLVQSSSVQKLKNSLRVQLSRKNTHLSVEAMIDQVNLILKTALHYYNLTLMIQKQLLPINNVLHKLFYKYLLRKFSSVPKIYSFIKTKFIDQNRFKVKNKILLRVTDTSLFCSVALASRVPSNEFLTANVYVDRDVVKRYVKSK